MSVSLTAMAPISNDVCCIGNKITLTHFTHFEKFLHKTHIQIQTTCVFEKTLIQIDIHFYENMSEQNIYIHLNTNIASPNNFNDFN